MKINDLYDAVYYINLAKRTDRRKKFWEYNGKFLDKKRTLRIEACDATSAPLLNGHLLNGSDHALTKTRTAHAVSYSSAFVHALEQGYQKIFIFEDDAKPLFGDIETFFFYEEKAQSLNYDMLYCGGWSPEPSKFDKVNDYLLKINGNMLCTQSIGFNYNQKVFESLASLNDFDKTYELFNSTRNGPEYPDGTPSASATDMYMNDNLTTCTNSYATMKLLFGQYMDMSDIEGVMMTEK